MCSFCAEKSKYLRICVFVSLGTNFLSFLRSKAIQRSIYFVDCIPWVGARPKGRFRACTGKLDFSTFFSMFRVIDGGKSEKHLGYVSIL